MCGTQTDQLRADFKSADASLTYDQITEELKALASDKYEDDDAFRAWASGAEDAIQARIKAVASNATAVSVEALLSGLDADARKALLAKLNA